MARRRKYRSTRPRQSFAQWYERSLRPMRPAVIPLPTYGKRIQTVKRYDFKDFHVRKKPAHTRLKKVGVTPSSFTPAFNVRRVACTIERKRAKRAYFGFISTKRPSGSGATRQRRNQFNMRDC